jgi:UrcA family protein
MTSYGGVMVDLRTEEPNMKPKLTFSLVSGAVSVLAAAGLAIAQEPVEEMEEITVEAPIVSRMVGGPAVIGAKTEVIELRRRVTYADLDLSKQADVIELETRIRAAAEESCEKLHDAIPWNPWDRQEIQRCTNQAVGGSEE